MYIDVNDILRRGDGATTDYEIADEQPMLEGITLASPLSGTIRLTSFDDEVTASGKLAADTTLECSRCLRAFTHHLEFSLTAEFAEKPDEDQFPIDKHGKIDLTEPIRQEIEIHMPLVALCQEDCDGLELTKA